MSYEHNLAETLEEKLLGGTPPGMGSTLADRLRQAMRHKGLRRQVQLDRAVAGELKIPYNPGWTHDVLTGQTTMPRGPRLTAACRVLGVRERWLMTGDGPMEIDPDPAEGPVSYSEVSGWTEAVKDPTVAALPKWVVDAVGRSPALVRPVAVTSSIVIHAVALWLASAPEEERIAAAHAEEERRRGELPQL